jgi:hypothetical protein
LLLLLLLLLQEILHLLVKLSQPIKVAADC